VHNFVATPTLMSHLSVGSNCLSKTKILWAFVNYTVRKEKFCNGAEH
jgi:hypothetical protein